MNKNTIIVVSVAVIALGGFSIFMLKSNKSEDSQSSSTQKEKIRKPEEFDFKIDKEKLFNPAESSMAFMQAFEKAMRNPVRSPEEAHNLVIKMRKEINQLLKDTEKDPLGHLSGLNLYLNQFLNFATGLAPKKTDELINEAELLIAKANHIIPAKTPRQFNYRASFITFLQNKNLFQKSKKLLDQYLNEHELTPSLKVELLSLYPDPQKWKEALALVSQCDKKMTFICKRVQENLQASLKLKCSRPSKKLTIFSASRRQKAPYIQEKKRHHSNIYLDPKSAVYGAVDSTLLQKVPRSYKVFLNPTSKLTDQLNKDQRTIPLFCLGNEEHVFDCRYIKKSTLSEPTLLFQVAESEGKKLCQN